MKKYLIWTAFAGSFIAYMRMAPGFSMFWQEWISLPVLTVLAQLGGRLPFVLLELAAPALAIFLLAGMLCRRFLRRLLCAALILASMYLGVWYPLYFMETPAYAASQAQLSDLCESLIDELNASTLDFSDAPDLPAKFARFPGWMRALNLGGFASFFTGEAIVSPELPPAALPFVAIHERMHLKGIAGEGAANIAAWKACMTRGGAYADSARLYALRCAMGLLPHGLRSGMLQRMDDETYHAYRACGGSFLQSERPWTVRTLYRLLGIGVQANDYGNLAAYLASGLPQ